MESILRSKRFLILLAFGVLVVSSSCRRDRQPLLPNVTGRAGEVVLVVNAPVWESESGRALGRLLTREHPALPQQEPMFDLVRIAHGAFSNIFKTHRNILIVNVSGQFEDTRMVIRKNVWAKPQTVLEINAADAEALHSFITSQEERILEEFVTAERERIIEYNRQYERSSIRASLTEKYDVSLVFPPGYTLDVESEDFAWIGFETPRTSQGVFVYHYQYTDPETFTPEFLVSKRNEVLRNNVPGPLPNTWMTTEMEFFPEFSNFMDGDRYFAKLRGLWRVENDFMGGPFVSLTTLDEERNRIITVEGYVFAPGDKKRNFLRQVEGIIYTLEIK